MDVYNIVATPLSFGFATIPLRKMIIEVDDDEIFKCDLVADMIENTIAVDYCRNANYHLARVKFTYEELGIDEKALYN